MFKEKNIKIFKKLLESFLIKKPLPKEDYKRIEKAIKKLEQADINDVIYNIKSQEETLKKQIEAIARESINVDAQIENAYEFYIAAFIQKELADKVGLDIGFSQLDQKELMKHTVKEILGQ